MISKKESITPLIRQKVDLESTSIMRVDGPALKVILATLTSVMVLGFGACWLCLHDPAIAYLSNQKGAEWITDSRPIEGTRHPAEQLTTVFERQFFCRSTASFAHLQLRAFRSASATLNGTPVLLDPTEETNWKSTVDVDVTGLLTTGTNILTVRVMNSLGPPVLWLRLEAGQASCGTDEAWASISDDGTRQPVRLARSPLELTADSPFYCPEPPVGALVNVGCILALVSVVAFGAVVLTRRFLQRFPCCSRSFILVLLGLIVLVRTWCFIHDAPLMPESAGFDAKAHEEYIGFIMEHGRLPLPSDGWEMHQPPLYYTLGALLLKTCKLSITQEGATTVLRSFNCIIGLLNCWVVLLCLRRLFPSDLQAQAVGLILAGFLPCHFYLSQYVTNDPLAGLLATLAFYGLLRANRQHRIRPYILIGVLLGAALLTKLYVILLIPLFPLALGARLITQPAPEVAKANLDYHSDSASNDQGKQFGWRSWALASATMLITSLLVSGWHFVRVWTHPGQPLVGNWEGVSSFAWWQDPGFRMGHYYSHFGHALIQPLFSGLNSFGDGLYSTLWADGLLSGAASLAFRPPWNYGPMNAACLFAAVLSTLAAIGLALELVRLVREPTPERLIVVGSLFGFAAGIVWLSLRVPSPASVKSFYALPALVPFCAIFSIGWRWVARKVPSLQSVLATFLIVWAIISCAGFWIRKDNPQIPFLRGFSSLALHRVEAAKASFERALELDDQAHAANRTTLIPFSRAEAHLTLGMIAASKGELQTAIVHYRNALEVRESCDAALNNLAWILATSSQQDLRDGPEAVRLASKACALSHNRVTVYIGTLAAAYAEAGRYGEAVATARKAAELAKLRNEPALAERNLQLAELYEAGRAYTDPAK